MQSCELKEKTKHMEMQKIILLSKPNGIDIRMVKQKVCGVVLSICGAAPMIFEKDITAFIFLSFFFLPMIFSKRYIMTFKENKQYIK